MPLPTDDDEMTALRSVHDLLYGTVQLGNSGTVWILLRYRGHALDHLEALIVACSLCLLSAVLHVQRALCEPFGKRGSRIRAKIVSDRRKPARLANPGAMGTHPVLCPARYRRPDQNVLYTGLPNV